MSIPSNTRAHSRTPNTTRVSPRDVNVDRATLETLVRHLRDDPETGATTSSGVPPAAEATADEHTPLPRRARGR